MNPCSFTYCTLFSKNAPGKRTLAMHGGLKSGLVQTGLKFHLLISALCRSTTEPFKKKKKKKKKLRSFVLLFGEKKKKTEKTVDNCLHIGWLFTIPRRAGGGQQHL